jgi:DNA-binding protein WhiA
MTFSYNARTEASKLNITNECCNLAELSAIIKTSAVFSLENGKFAIVINTELPDLYEKVNGILEKLYGFSVEMEISDDENMLHKIRYEIKISVEHSTQVLRDCGIIFLNELGQIEFKDGVDKYVASDECCKKAYIRGVFIGASTNNIVITGIGNNVKRNQSGYHLEFVFMSENMADEFSHLLAEFEINSKKTERKNNFVVYIKEGDVISDLFALMGLSKSVFKLQNEIALRSLRNVINRQNNCVTGNISKTVNASIKQITAINIIQEAAGLESLTVNLQEAAMLRLANPEESLERLVLLSSKPITKSGLMHRFRKILSIANNLK